MFDMNTFANLNIYLNFSKAFALADEPFPLLRLDRLDP